MSARTIERRVGTGPLSRWGRRSTLVLALLAVWLPGSSARSRPRPPAPKYVAPNIYTPPVVVDQMLRLARVGADDVVVDLGCGDGRIVIAAARVHGAHGVCVDLDQNQLRLARDNARAAGVEDRIRFVQQDLFAADLAGATVVTLFLSPKVNDQLAPRLAKALAPGARVLSHQFSITGWYPMATLTVRDENRFERTVYLWEIGTQTLPPRKLPTRRERPRRR